MVRWLNKRVVATTTRLPPRKKEEVNVNCYSSGVGGKRKTKQGVVQFLIVELLGSKEPATPSPKGVSCV